MWYKLFLLLLYLVVLFLLARILELLSWYENGLLADKLFDPMTLSVGKLKALLDSRGVSYEAVVERKELEDLVDTTGAVTEDDLEAIEMEENKSVTNFTNGNHFYEEVEDKKDSVWLVEVRLNDRTPSALSDTHWKTVRKKMSIFGIRAGLFDCSRDWRFCEKKGWTTPRLVLAHPSEFQSKANVILNTYSGSTKPNYVQNWVKQKLNEQIKRLKNYTQVQSNWLSYEDAGSGIRLIVLTQLSTLPMFFTALSVKFPGRVRFGTVDTNTKEGKNIMKKLNLKKAPVHLVVTAEKTHIYGSRPGEALTFRHMERFLKSLYPEVNDLFLLSLFLCNTLSCLELVLSQGGFVRRIFNVLWCFLKYNMIVILLWLPLLGLFQLPFMTPVVHLGLKSIRMVNNTYLASLIRKDYFLYSMKWTLLAATSVAYAFIVGFMEYKKSSGTEEGEVDDRSEWDFSNFRTLSHLFSPLSRRPLGFGMYMYVGLEERGGIIPAPALWPSNVSTSYINQLPTWLYQNRFTTDCSSKGDNSDKGSRSQTSVVGEEGESSSETSLERSPVGEAELEGVANPPDPAHPKCDSAVANSQPVTGSQFTCVQCAICLDLYETGVLLCGLPCGHVFHKSCIMTWLTHDNHICPLCRWPAYKPKVCQLHLHTE